jgi:hypothetical protein
MMKQAAKRLMTTTTAALCDMSTLYLNGRRADQGCVDPRRYATLS